MRFATDAYARLLERGCLCGGDDPASCPVHPEPGDNRGIAAYFKAGLPNGFPMVATCSICRAEGLMYPSVELDRGEVPAGEAPGPTLICPRCSRPAHETRLRADAEQFGYDLNGETVFGGAGTAVAA